MAGKGGLLSGILTQLKGWGASGVSTFVPLIALP
jgi:hypothetical protein